MTKKKDAIYHRGPTIRRLLKSINAEVVDQAIYGWLNSHFSGPTLAFDGKVLKGARDHEGKKVHLLSAIIHQEGITIAQRQVESKTNEIPTARSLLETFDLKGKVVIGDALHTQKDLARFLVQDKKADIKALALNEGFSPKRKLLIKSMAVWRFARFGQAPKLMIMLIFHIVDR